MMSIIPKQIHNCPAIIDFIERLNIIPDTCFIDVGRNVKLMELE